MPKRVRCSQSIGVTSDIVPDTPSRGATITKMQGDRVLRLSRHDPDRCAQVSSTKTKFNHIAVLQFFAVGEFRTNECSVIPGQLGQWTRQFLKPAVVRIAAAENVRIGTKDELKMG